MKKSLDIFFHVTLVFEQHVPPRVDIRSVTSDVKGSLPQGGARDQILVLYENSVRAMSEVYMSSEYMPLRAHFLVFFKKSLFMLIKRLVQPCRDDLLSYWLEIDLSRG